MTRPPQKTPSRGLTVRVKKSGGRTPAQRAWLERQLNDPYVAAAKAHGYRSRAAYKLTEIDDRLRVLKPTAQGTSALHCP